MSRADIQYMPLRSDPSRRRYDPTSELTTANIWLSGGLDEEREARRDSEKWRTALSVMLAVTVSLLILTWGGYIPV